MPPVHGRVAHRPACVQCGQQCRHASICTMHHCGQLAGCFLPIVAASRTSCGLSPSPILAVPLGIYPRLGRRCRRRSCRRQRGIVGRPLHLCPWRLINHDAQLWRRNHHLRQLVQPEWSEGWVIPSPHRQVAPTSDSVPNQLPPSLMWLSNTASSMQVLTIARPPRAGLAPLAGSWCG